MKSRAERFEQRIETAQLQNQIARTNPRLAQLIEVCRQKDRQRALAERVRKRK